MSLTRLDLLNGILGTLLVGTSIILGLIITFKYFKNKDINFLYVGIAWCFFVSGWYGTTISFFVALITGGEGLSFAAILAWNFIPLPIGLISWLMAFTNFLYKERQKLIIGIYLLITFIFYIIFLYFLINDPGYIGHKISPVDTTANPSILIVYLLFFIFSFLLTGLKFAWESIKIDNPETKIKGKLLLAAFPTFCVGAILDATFPSNAVTLIIFRVILILSAFEFYNAFMLPKWMKKILIKSESAN
ncbi:MAG: hypothetical protein ACTSU4_12330 [Promethearchaeota archaeon]